MTSNALNRIFINGMSEIYSLLFLVLFFRYENRTILSGILLGLSVFVRPIIAIGLGFLAITKKSISTVVSFVVVLIIPLIHNLYFGSKFVFFTSSWNSKHAFRVDEVNLGNIVNSVIETSTKNLNYILMNPFSEEIFIRVGRLLPFTIFVVILITICILLFNTKSSFPIRDFFKGVVATFLTVAPF